MLGPLLMGIIIGSTTPHVKKLVTNQPIISRMKKVGLKNFMIGTWNVGSLYRAGYFTTVISELNDID